MSKIAVTMAFSIGVAMGSVCTWYLIKDKYAHIAEEEIESVKEVFLKKEKVSEEEGDIDTTNTEKPSIKEYAEKLHSYGYSNYSSNNETGDDEMASENKPYVITPDEFMEYDDYDHISLTYYADGFLTDENDEIIENVAETVGEDALNHFGEYEDDSVYVRNDAKKCDYEILLDQRNYGEVYKRMPHKVEGE